MHSIMKAKVDKSACIGCGLCAGIAPDVFRMDDDGVAEAYQDATEGNKDAVQEAIDSCPTSAIDWAD